MLTSSHALNTAAGFLEVSDFYYAEHQVLFHSLKTAYQAEKPADIHLIGEELKHLGELESVGGISYLTTLAQYAGTSAFIEEYVRDVKHLSSSRQLVIFGHEIANAALKNPSDPNSLFEKAEQRLSLIQRGSHSFHIPFLSMADRLATHDDAMKQFRGQKYLGLCQKTIPEIDDKLLGLRRLILLAAAPNAGKTALTVQFSIDILKAHPEACLVYFSLEMGEPDIFTRVFCNLTEMSYRTYVRGSLLQERELDPSAYFTKEEMESIERARSTLSSIGDRLQIVDLSQVPSLDVSKAVSFINDIKERTKTNRAIVMVDYLQVWPLPSNTRFTHELEIDKWRVGEMKKIRDAINNDPVIVISEARKPQGDDKWGTGLSSVMGAARTTYTPDVVFLLQQMSLEDMGTLVGKKGDDQLKQLQSSLRERSLTFCKLDCDKGREGMDKFSLYLKFFYHKNIFLPVTRDEIKEELAKGIEPANPKNIKTPHKGDVSGQEDLFD
jgi:replicative DNA helicase